MVVQDKKVTVFVPKTVEFTVKHRVSPLHELPRVHKHTCSSN